MVLWEGVTMQIGCNHWALYAFRKPYCGLDILLGGGHTPSYHYDLQRIGQEIVTIAMTILYRILSTHKELLGALDRLGPPRASLNVKWIRYSKVIFSIPVISEVMFITAKGCYVHAFTSVC